MNPPLPLNSPEPSCNLPKIAFLGNHPPRLCGIATFTHDLCQAVTLAAPQTECYVGAVNDHEKAYDYPPQVRFQLLEKDLDSYRRAADFLNFNQADVLCVQHEFGIYGGPGGSHLLALLREVRMPVVTTLHTVLSDPTPVQRQVMEELAAYSDRLVVMAEKGAEILRETYGLQDAKIAVIPHGIPDVPFAESGPAKAQFGVEGRQVLFTFGLIGPGKGIEQVIEALPEIIRDHPEAVYLVLGATHPNLLATEGERYRLKLKRLAEDRGVSAHVIFHNRFVSAPDLKEFIAATDIYVTPYLNEEQVTSGTLAYVFGAGKAVVSTPYWHARELLDQGRGELVPFRDPGAIAKAVCGLLDDPARMQKIRRQAHAIGREMIWSAVADRYLKTFREVRAQRKENPRAAFANWTLNQRPEGLPPHLLDHIVRMSDGTGIFQHAIFNVPNFHEGYCTDDNARAFILCNLLDEIGASPPSNSLNKLATGYLGFLAAALDYDRGRFRNFMSHGRCWLEKVGSEDSHGRALWAVGSGAGRSRDAGHTQLSAQLFERAIPIVETFSSPRAWAFALLGLHEYRRRFTESADLDKLRTLLGKRLIKSWHTYATKEWPWFEESVTYENARFCQALLLVGQSGPDQEALRIGLESLQWLVTLQTGPSGCFRPIGSNGFYPKGGPRADFDQQPVEAQAMVSACIEAHHATGKAYWLKEAKRAFEWFLGRNDLGLPLYEFTSGGCSDGLHAGRVSQNQGAESTLAFHLALAEMRTAEQPVSETRPLSPLDQLSP